MFDFLLKLGAITIPFVIAAIIMVDRLGFSVGIRKGGNTFTGQIANLSILSWATVALIILEISILIMLYARHRPGT